MGRRKACPYRGDKNVGAGFTSALFSSTHSNKKAVLRNHLHKHNYQLFVAL